MHVVPRTQFLKLARNYLTSGLGGAVINVVNDVKLTFVDNLVSSSMLATF